MIDFRNTAEPSSTQVVVKDGSTVSCFKMTVLLPVYPLLSEYGDDGLRGVAPIQEGGRFLYYDTVELDSEPIQIMLTLHEGSQEGAYRVAGELSGKLVPRRIKATLAVGPKSYEASAERGKVEFNDVIFPGDVKAIRIELETSDEDAEQGS